MSGVCAKHHGYVQPGEACPYCEPSLRGPTYLGVLILACDHTRRAVNRDACADCGMSAMAIMQQLSVTIPVGTGPIA